MTPAPEPPSLQSMIAAARASGDYHSLIQAVPYMRFLGLSAQNTPEGFVVSLPASNHLIGNAMLPAIHGGVVAGLLDCAASLTMLVDGGMNERPKVIDMTVDYMRSARVMNCYAQGRITKLGRRVASVHVDAWQDDRAKPIAVGLFHFLAAQN